MMRLMIALHPVLLRGATRVICGSCLRATALKFQHIRAPYESKICYATLNNSLETGTRIVIVSEDAQRISTAILAGFD
jgi:hypothetical protein